MNAELEDMEGKAKKHKKTKEKLKIKEKNKKVNPKSKPKEKDKKEEAEDTERKTKKKSLGAMLRYVIFFSFLLKKCSTKFNINTILNQNYFF